MSQCTSVELAVVTLGETAATEFIQDRDADGFGECRAAAIDGAQIAGDARRQIEKKLGRSVVTDKTAPAQRRLQLRPVNQSRKPKAS